MPSTQAAAGRARPRRAASGPAGQQTKKEKRHTRGPTLAADRTAGPRAAHPDRQDGQGGDNGGRKGGGGPVKSSHIIEEHIDVGVPREVAYDQWTRYGDLPKYSKHESAEVKRRDRVGFTSKIGPSRRKWDAQVVEQLPGRRIAWRSIGGAQTMGVVSFHRLDDRLTRVMVEMEYHPKGAVETVGNFLRMQRRRVRKNLRLFKHFIEVRGDATGRGGEKVASDDGGLRQETDEHLGVPPGKGGSRQHGNQGHGPDANGADHPRPKESVS